MSQLGQSLPKLIVRATSARPLIATTCAQAPGTSPKCHVWTHAALQMDIPFDCHLVRRAATRRTLK